MSNEMRGLESILTVLLKNFVFDNKYTDNLCKFLKYEFKIIMLRVNELEKS